MKKLLLALTLFTTLTHSIAQDCESLVPFEEGTLWEIQSYDKKGNPEDVMTQKVTGVSETEEGKKVEIHQVLKDKKDELVAESDYAMTCNRGIYKVSMERMMTSESMASFKDMEVEIEGDDIEFPSNLSVGKRLNDANLKISMVNSTAGIPMMSLTTRVYNRKVEAQEKVTVGAGEFDAYVITYDVEAKTIIKVQTKGKDWYVPGVGIVKSEYYNKKGKLTGSQELVKFEN